MALASMSWRHAHVTKFIFPRRYAQEITNLHTFRCLVFTSLFLPRELYIVIHITMTQKNHWIRCDLDPRQGSAGNSSTQQPPELFNSRGKQERNKTILKMYNHREKFETIDKKSKKNQKEQGAVAKATHQKIIIMPPSVLAAAILRYICTISPQFCVKFILKGMLNTDI